MSHATLPITMFLRPIRSPRTAAIIAALEMIVVVALAIAGR
jgi:hypothetical protein